MKDRNGLSTSSFLPQRTEDVELEPDVRARLQSLGAEVELFRNSGALDPTAAKKLQDYFRLQHIFHSTGIEGNRLSLRETEVVLMEGIELNDQPLADQLEVKDLNAAVNFLEECSRGDGPIREIDIREMHRLTVGHTPNANPGAYRTIGVLITGSEHRPPEPLAVPGAMEEFVAWLDQAHGLEPMVFASLAHHNLAAIHPFTDGNGRVARLLGNLILMRAGYPIVNIKREDRPRYYDALTFADLGLYSPLITLAMDRALEVFAEMKRIRDETERARQWAERWGKKEAEVIQRREEREYRIWLGLMENVRLEFENRADLLSEQLQTIKVELKAYPPPDLTKYLELREKGHAERTWFFSVRFRGEKGSPQTFFWSLYRPPTPHYGHKAVPLRLNWFDEEGEPTPVDHPKIRLREIYFDRERKLCIRMFENGVTVTTTRLTAAQIAELFFEDVLKQCFGITTS